MVGVEAVQRLLFVVADAHDEGEDALVGLAVLYLESEVDVGISA